MPDAATADRAPAPKLSSAQRSALRADAHHLDPVVMIGDSGLSTAVLAETDRALEVHQLIKIRVLGDDREARTRIMGELCAALGCAPVQMIGKLLVVWRPAPLKPQVEDFVPKKEAAQRADARQAQGAAPAPRRPRSRKPAEPKPVGPRDRSRPMATPKAGGRSKPDGARPKRADTAPERATGERRRAPKPEVPRAPRPVTRGAARSTGGVARSAGAAARSAGGVTRSAGGAARPAGGVRPSRPASSAGARRKASDAAPPRAGAQTRSVRPKGGAAQTTRAQGSAPARTRSGPTHRPGRRPPPRKR